MALDPGSYTHGVFTHTDDATGSLTVEAAVDPVVGTDPPQDPDGDGAHEDVNGDGATDIADLVALLNDI